MAGTKIEWAEKVWNPIVGCSKVSSGCKHCYAERMAARLAAMGKPEYLAVVTDGGRWNGHVKCLPEKLDDPLHWKKPRRVFVNSMSDLFHEDVPLDFILRCWMVMAGCAGQTFIILTKRPERMHRFITEWLPGAWGLATMSLQLLDYPIPNIWLGVSVEDRKTADERLTWLARTPAAKHVVSYEPALEQILFSLTKYQPIDWLIMGCESGPKARPMDIEWAKSTLNWCESTGTPFFLKQMVVNGKLVKMPELYGQVWAQYPKGFVK